MITKRKITRKTASSAMDGGGKIIDAGVEVVKNIDSVDHWGFLDEIEAPMWADLSLCNLTNDETDDSWFDISHQFHQCSASQLLSTIFHPNSITIQEPPPSPKLPPSVSKSRGKNYKIKAWGQTNNKQHPLKTLTLKSSTNKSKLKSTSSEAIKVYSSCGSGLTDTSRPKISKSSFCSITSQQQEQEGSAKSTVTSNHIEDLLSSLKNNLRRSCATRPAARVVTTRSSEGLKSSSSKSSVGSSSKGINVISTVSKVPNITKKNVQSLPNRQRINTLASKVQVQQHTSLGRVLKPLKANEQNKIIAKNGEKRGDDRCPPILGGIKKTASASQKGISGKKEDESIGHVQKGCKQNMTQKNGSQKLIGLKEKTNTQSRDKDTSRKVYFR